MSRRGGGQAPRSEPGCPSRWRPSAPTSLRPAPGSVDGCPDPSVGRRLPRGTAPPNATCPRSPTRCTRAPWVGTADAAVGHLSARETSHAPFGLATRSARVCGCSPGPHLHPRTSPCPDTGSPRGTLLLPFTHTNSIMTLSTPSLLFVLEYSLVPRPGSERCFKISPADLVSGRLPSWEDECGRL